MLPYPEKCLRGITKCKPYSQIQSEGLPHERSFFCCGKNDGTMAPVPEDIYTLCFRGEFRNSISYNDRRDLVDQMHVIAVAMSHIELDMLDEAEGK